MIPRAVFQTWKSKDRLPAKFAFWSSTWVERNPGFRHVLWDDADNRSFVAEKFPWFLPTYDSFPAEIMRVDSVRYLYLFEFGGVYSDLDFHCLKPLEPLLAELEGDWDVVLGRMVTREELEERAFPPQWLNWCHANSIPNAVMISKPREPFRLFVLSSIMKREDVARPEVRTGPVLLKECYERYQASSEVADEVLRHFPGEAFGRSRVKVLDPPYFYPVDWTDPLDQAMVVTPVSKDADYLPSTEELEESYPSSYAVTFWCNSWEKNTKEFA